MRQVKSLNSAKIIYLERKKIIDELKRIALNIKKEEKDNLKDLILFGSLSRDDFTGLSDVDILIILHNSKEKFIERIRKFRKYFFLPIDVDILVYTQEEVNKLIKEGNPFIKEVLKGGIKII